MAAVSAESGSRCELCGWEYVYVATQEAQRRIWRRANALFLCNIAVLLASYLFVIMLLAGIFAFWDSEGHHLPGSLGGSGGPQLTYLAYGAFALMGACSITQLVMGLRVFLRPWIRTYIAALVVVRLATYLLWVAVAPVYFLGWAPLRFTWTRRAVWAATEISQERGQVGEYVAVEVDR
jgi:hypothetical protein